MKHRGKEKRTLILQTPVEMERKERISEEKIGRNELSFLLSFYSLVKISRSVVHP